MVRITGVEISYKPKCVEKKPQFRKVWKHFKSDFHNERNGRNDDLNKVHNNWNGAHDRSWNFVKAKMWKTKTNFEKFQNALYLIYTVGVMLEMMRWTTFGIVSMVRLTGVEIS